jgi:hypothetical protein
MGTTKDDLQYVTVELERPRPCRDFHGRVAEGQFVCEGDHIVLYDMQGQRLAKQLTPANWTPRQTVARALKSRESLKNSDFNRRLVYPRTYY